MEFGNISLATCAMYIYTRVAKGANILILIIVFVLFYGCLFMNGLFFPSIDLSLSWHICSLILFFFIHSHHTDVKFLSFTSLIIPLFWLILFFYHKSCQSQCSRILYKIPVILLPFNVQVVKSA